MRLPGLVFDIISESGGVLIKSMEVNQVLFLLVCVGK